MIIVLAGRQSEKHFRRKTKQNQTKPKTKQALCIFVCCVNFTLLCVFFRRPISRAIRAKGCTMEITKETTNYQTLKNQIHTHIWNFFNLWGFDFANLCVHLCFPIRPYSFFYLQGFQGNPGLCPTGNLHLFVLFNRHSRSRVKTSSKFTLSHYKIGLSAYNLPLQGKLPYESKYFISPITRKSFSVKF